jgi:hypothetical protein
MLLFVKLVLKGKKVMKNREERGGLRGGHMMGVKEMEYSLMV